MKRFFTNWKTSLAGVITLAGVGLKIAHGGFDLTSDLPAITAGVGLLAAKDGNVTGGTKPQNGGTLPADPAVRADDTGSHGAGH